MVRVVLNQTSLGPLNMGDAAAPEQSLATFGRDSWGLRVRGTLGVS